MNESEIMSYEEYLKDELIKVRKERDDHRLSANLSLWRIERLEQEIKDYEAKIESGDVIPHYVSRMQSKMACQANTIASMQKDIGRKNAELRQLRIKLSKKEGLSQ